MESREQKFVFDKSKIMEALLKRAEGFFYSEEILEYGEREEKKKEDKLSSKTAEGDLSNLSDQSKNNSENVSKNTKNKKQGVYSGQSQGENGAKIAREEQVNHEDSKNLVLLKKKVTTHYVPPDIAAVKMLFENFGEALKSETDAIEEMSDEELVKLRLSLLDQLKSE